jgi:hypothetical protein
LNEAVLAGAGPAAAPAGDAPAVGDPVAPPTPPAENPLHRVAPQSGRNKK